MNGHARRHVTNVVLVSIRGTGRTAVRRLPARQPGVPAHIPPARSRTARRQGWSVVSSAGTSTVP